MSFAIIETGGKQYKVSTSKILEIEKLDAKKGETIKFKNVLSKKFLDQYTIKSMEFYSKFLDVSFWFRVF